MERRLVRDGSIEDLEKLIDEAERICSEEFDKKLLFVLSGIGVKEYYRKLGFIDDGVYLSKILHQ